MSGGYDTEDSPIINIDIYACRSREINIRCDSKSTTESTEERGLYPTKRGGILRDHAVLGSSLMYPASGVASVAAAPCVWGTCATKPDGFLGHEMVNMPFAQAKAEMVGSLTEG